MQRKPGFPVANCGIKMPDCIVMPDPLLYEEDGDQQQRRQQLINFGHSQWGFNNWSWSVSKQELDFVDFTNGKYCAGVVAFVSITVKSFDIHRENIGYATSTANSKGFAIYKSRKCAVTNALRETLLSFGGSVASELAELLEAPANAPEQPAVENNQNVANRHEHSVLPERARKEPERASPHPVLRSPLAPQPVQNGPLAPPPVQNGPHVPPPVQNGPLAPPPVQNGPLAPPPVQNGPLAPPPVQNGPLAPPPAVKNAPRVLGGMPANRPPAPAPTRAASGPAAPPCAAHPRPNSNLPKTVRPENQPMIVEQEPPKMALEGLGEEEARAERKRRQRQAQEEFRLKQLMKQQGLDDKQELGRNSSSFDHLLLEIPTQDIMIEATGEESGKRKSPGHDGSAAKRRNSFKSKLDIVTAD